MLVQLLHMYPYASFVESGSNPRAGVAWGSSTLARWTGALALAAILAIAPGSSRAANGESELQITGLTFVGSREDGGELVLRATRALLMPDTEEADLFGVRVEVTQTRGTNFTMRCEKAQLNLETNDFFAEGDVKGVTAEGERYSAPWVRYSEQDDLLYTDGPVSMENDNGRYSGDGFKYHVTERRFRLIGNVRVEQVR